MDSVAQLVKNLPAMQETRVWSLGQEDPLEQEMAATPGFLSGKSHGQKESGGLQSMEHRGGGHDLATK